MMMIFWVVVPCRFKPTFRRNTVSIFRLKPQISNQHDFSSIIVLCSANMGANMDSDNYLVIGKIRGRIHDVNREKHLQFKMYTAEQLKE
jgi:hypothetical protein